MLADLDDACCHLEASMGRMMQVQWGSAVMQQGQLNLGVGREVGDDMVQTDVRFDHSWTPGGFEPGPGWYWIPKGTLLMDTYYPARQNEISHFGHLARRIRRPPPPAPLTQTFARATAGAMANHGPNQPLKRRQGWHEDWMEEDNLLDEEHDLRRQLQRGARSMGKGSRGRRMDGVSNRRVMQGDQEWFNQGKGAMGYRSEAIQGQVQ